METNKKYNGWTNYETWVVVSELDNCEEDYETIMSKLRSYNYPKIRTKNLKIREKIIKDFASFIEEYVHADTTESDILNANSALLSYIHKSVNFEEIAEGYFKSVYEEKP